MATGVKVLCTGGSGLLGTSLKKLLPDALFPTSSEFDICSTASMESYAKNKDISVVLHAAAFTSPPRIEEEPMRALDVNIVGTANVVKFCAKRKCRLIYISTDYVFRGDDGNYGEDDPVCPVNRYAWSKLGGECAVRMYDDSLIVRTSFGPEPFPYEKAFVDQWTSRETVSVIATKLVALLNSTVVGILHVGGKRRSVYEYALSCAQGKRIGELSTSDVSFPVPRDTSLNCSRYAKTISTIFAE